MAAFSLAAEMGADGIELDVHLSSDGRERSTLLRSSTMTPSMKLPSDVPVRMVRAASTR
jgi:hypothetical protein